MLQSSSHTIVMTNYFANTHHELPADPVSRRMMLQNVASTPHNVQRSTKAAGDADCTYTTDPENEDEIVTVFETRKGDPQRGDPEPDWDLAVSRGAMPQNCYMERHQPRSTLLESRRKATLDATRQKSEDKKKKCPTDDHLDVYFVEDY